FSSITWHQWHHTASRSSSTKRCSAFACLNTSSDQETHCSLSGVCVLTFLAVACAVANELHMTSVTARIRKLLQERRTIANLTGCDGQHSLHWLQNVRWSRFNWLGAVES